jgi:hypothetical protein
LSFPLSTVLCLGLLPRIESLKSRAKLLRDRVRDDDGVDGGVEGDAVQLLRLLDGNGVLDILEDPSGALSSSDIGPSAAAPDPEVADWCMTGAAAAEGAQLIGLTASNIRERPLEPDVLATSRGSSRWSSSCITSACSDIGTPAETCESLLLDNENVDEGAQLDRRIRFMIVLEREDGDLAVRG